MDISILKRNPEAVKSDLKTIGGKEIITKQGCKIYFPSRYEEQGLAVIGSLTELLGFFAIVYDNNTYGVFKILAKIKTRPDEISTVKINGESYLEFTYNPNSTVIENTEVVQDSGLLYDTWNEFISKGKVPWFFSYRDLSSLYINSKHYTGVQLGANHVIWEMLAANISRVRGNLETQYRHSIKKMEDLIKSPPTIVKLNSVTYGTSNTTSKLIGSYWEESVNSALLNPSKSKENIETLLRQ